MDCFTSLIRTHTHVKNLKFANLFVKSELINYLQILTVHQILNIKIIIFSLTFQSL